MTRYCKCRNYFVLFICAYMEKCLRLRVGMSEKYLSMLTSIKLFGISVNHVKLLL